MHHAQAQKFFECTIGNILIFWPYQKKIKMGSYFLSQGATQRKSNFSAFTITFLFLGWDGLWTNMSQFRNSLIGWTYM